MSSAIELVSETAQPLIRRKAQLHCRERVSESIVNCKAATYV